MSDKYIFVSGGVISGLGKGITTAAIACLLKSAGYKVVPVKCENYLNIDAGTINPIEHGDPFLCQDGTEADMDIGTYEKFLDTNMSRHNFITIGQIYRTVIDKERRFEYFGEDVEAIPYITDEIVKRINTALKKGKAQIALIELGGTAGEYQNILYYEASRILTLKNPGDVIHVHVSYVPTPPHLGEPKTKPTQLSVRTLNSMGIQPDILITRSEKKLDERRKERLSFFCNVNSENIISSHNVKTVYQVPLIFEQQNLTSLILTKLGLKIRKPELKKWQRFVRSVNKKKGKVKIAIVGKYFATGQYQLRDSYAALFDALDHAAWANQTEVEADWVDAEKVEKKGVDQLIEDIDGLIVPIGWGQRGAEGMIEAAGFARENKIPYLGLCYGMQLAAVSFARDVLNLKGANTTENDPKTPHPIIHLMPSQKKCMERRAYGGTMRLGTWQAVVKKGTLSWQIYHQHDAFEDKRKNLISERHRHRFEFNNRYALRFEKRGFVISARSRPENLVEIIELPKKNHPFYLATQGHPEYKSRPLKPHPIFIEFIKACLKKRRMLE